MVVVTDHARISRDLTALLHLIEHLKSLGVRVVTLQNYLDSACFQSEYTRQKTEDAQPESAQHSFLDHRLDPPTQTWWGVPNTSRARRWFESGPSPSRFE
ncbi:MAG: hypothetical protein LZF62_480321 [Nitrospira sp.]|nr:MAG: hypothetical protein LZF62_480321 [Nitrospira sp.]